MGDADADVAVVKRTGRAGEGGAEGARALLSELPSSRLDGSGRRSGEG